MATVKLAATAAVCLFIGFADAQRPYWDQPFLDPLIIPYGGAQLLNGTTWTRLYFATEALGTYAMSPMISYLNGQFLATWKLAPTDEDQPGQKVMWSMSADGLNWTATDGTNVLFPSMNTSSNPAALFAEPSVYINGRVYAAASPKQFCLYPDQYQSVLLLRRVYDQPAPLGRFGPIFWAANSIPAGFEEASAAHNITALPQQDAQTQADVGTLTPASTAPPCQAPVGGTKCEFCPGGCQDWAAPLNISGIENERSHYRVPNSTVDVLLYRSRNETLFASVRPSPGQAWSTPVQTNITNDVANLNAGMLPDGRPYLVSNAMINVFRDPLFLSTSSDGWAWDGTAAIGSCEQTAIFANPGAGQPWGCLFRYNGGAKEGGLQYPQALVVTDTPVAGLYVIVSQNKEDIWVARVPLPTSS